MTAHAQRSLQSNISRFYVFQFLLNFQLWWPIWVIYLTEERGLTLGQVTLIDVPFWLSIIVLQVPAAALSDRWGRKPTLIASSLVFGAAVTMFGLASTFPLLLASYLLWGCGFALLFGTESAFLYDTLKALDREEEYQRIYGRAWGLATAAALGGTLLGAPLAAETSLPVPILLSGAIAATAAIAALTFVEPTRERRAEQHMTYGRIIGDSVDVVRRQPSVRYGILFYGLITIGSLAPVFFFQPFLVEHDFGLGEVGLWQTPTRIAGIIGTVGAYRIVSTLGERQTFYMMPIVLFASFALLGLWDSVYAQVAFPLMNGVVFLSQPAVTDYLNRRVSTEQRATVVSLTNLIRAAVLVPVAPLLGVLAEEDLGLAFGVGAALVGALALPLMLVWAPHLRDEAPADAAAPATSVAGGD